MRKVGLLNNHPVIEESGITVTNKFGNSFADLLGSNASVLAKSGLAKSHAINPGANDDSFGTAGNGTFSAPSFWLNGVTDTLFICTDNSSGSAVWVDITRPSGNYLMGPPMNMSLQTQIDNMSSYSLAMIPEGITLVTSTSGILTRNKCGGHICGNGSTPPLLHANTGLYTRAVSYLVWGITGVENTPMIKLQGRDLHLVDITMLGDNYSSPGTWIGSSGVVTRQNVVAPATVGEFSIGDNISSLSTRTTTSTFDTVEAAFWEPTTPWGKYRKLNHMPLAAIHSSYDDGLGPGKNIIEKLVIQGFRVGVLVGEVPPTGGNCDQTICQKLTFYDCNNGFVFRNAQNMGWSIYDSEYASTGVFLNISGGGDIECYNTFFPYSCTALVLNQQIDPSISNAGWGPNNGYYKFEKIKTDAQAFSPSGRYFKLLDVLDTNYEQTVGADVIVNGLQLPTTSMFGTPSASNQRLATLRGSVGLTIRDSRFMGGLSGAFEWFSQNNRIARLNIENSTIGIGTSPATGILSITNSSGVLYLTMKNNRIGAGNKIDDFEGYVTGSL